MDTSELLSIIHNPEITYPSDDEYFSPSECYPEYHFKHLANKPNNVYKAVRECLYQLDLDKENYNTSNWNPLKGLITPGDKVFILCNFVCDKRVFETREEFLSKCTHGSVIRAVIDYVLIALRWSGVVRFGNAPIQSCDFSKVLEQTGSKKITEFYKDNNIDVQSKDLRYLIQSLGAFGNSTYELNPANEGIRIELGQESELEDIKNPGSFRVSMYDVQKTKKYHSNNLNAYYISYDVIDADVLISIPKLKTHEKVGFTGAIKGYVGTVTKKECLAHHRFGKTNDGGDEYPTDPIGIRKYFSRLHDYAYSTDNSLIGNQLLRILDMSIQRLLRRVGAIQFGSWWGNDTCWRMALDIARIVYFSLPDGLTRNKAKNQLIFVDGIVGGEGDGPLSSSPVNTGLLIFSNNAVLADYASATLIGFEPERIPILNNAMHKKDYPLCSPNFNRGVIVYNFEELTKNELYLKISHRFTPPRHWVGRI